MPNPSTNSREGEHRANLFSPAIPVGHTLLRRGAGSLAVVRPPVPTLVRAGVVFGAVATPPPPTAATPPPPNAVPRDAVEAGHQEGNDSFPTAHAPCVGGRLSGFLHQWQNISSDRFILSVIKAGFTILLHDDFPQVIRTIVPPPRDPAALRACESEIRSLLSKGAISLVVDYPDLCLSPVFTVPKKSGDLRMILNLKRINLFVQAQPFRMENLSVVLQHVRRNDWACSIDLKDAYFHVPIHALSQRLLGFRFGDGTYRYNCLPFGLKSSPWVFTRVVQTAIIHLRRLGVRIFFYLDDWLILAKSEALLRYHTDLVINLIESLGFLVNREKSHLTPTQRPVFLGAVLDTQLLLAYPAPHRVTAIIQLCSKVLKTPSSSAVTWQRLLGHLASILDLVPFALMFMRLLQLHLASFFCQGRDLPSCQIPLSPSVIPHLLRWTSEKFLTQGNSFAPPPPEIALYTDASLSGWGAHLDHHQASGIWSLPPSSLPHINILELKAVALALEAFCSQVQGQRVRVFTDNSTVVAYVNHQGGVKSPSLCQETLRLWEWCIAHKVFLIATHIPGTTNLIADALSRGSPIPSEWQLDPRIFRRLCARHGTPEIDLFATKESAQLPVFCARHPTPEARATNAFSISWSNGLGFAFPPTSLLPHVLSKIQTDGARVLLIAPNWPSRVWFSTLLSMLEDSPSSLPPSKNLLTQGKGQLWMKDPTWLHLVCWPLNGNARARRAFLKERLKSQQKPSELQHEIVTIQGSPSSQIGAINAISLPIRPL